MACARSCLPSVQRVCRIMFELSIQPRSRSPSRSASVRGLSPVDSKPTCLGSGTGCVLATLSSPSSHPTRQPEASSASFDHLVGAGEKGRWDGEAENSRCFQIDDKLECCGLLDRQVGGPRA